MKNPIKIIKDCIEKDEPYFVLRGKDRFAIDAIYAYYEAVSKGGATTYFVEEINEIRKDFETFASDIENLKIPD